MHSFDLNLDWVAEEERSAEALGSSDEDLNGFIDYFLHGSDSNVFQSNQTRLPEESRVIISSINEGIDFDFVELGLGFGLDSDTNNEAPFDLNVTVSDLEMLAVQSGESSSSSSVRELELVCEEDFRVLVNESNTNNQEPEMLELFVQDVEEENESNVIRIDGMMVDTHEIQFDGMMVDTIDELFSNYNEDEVDGEEDIGMNVNAADEDDDGDDVDYSLFLDWNNVHNEIVQNGPYIEGFDDDDGDGMLFSWEIWSAVDSEWDDDTYVSWSMLSMQTVTCDVDNLPSVTLTQEELNKNNSICAICMENFCVEEKLKRLPCFHYYHVDCISPWLRTRNTCPTCRYELPII